MSFPAARLLAPLVAVAGLLIAAPVVLGHAELTESDPMAGGSIATPYTLVFRYSEQIDPLQSSVIVRDSAGDIVGHGGVVEDAFTMVVGMDNQPVGAYVAHWVAITPDDQGKTQGDVPFNIVAATSSLSGTPAASATPPASATPTIAPQPSVTLPAQPSETPSAPTVETPAPTPSPTNTQAGGSELIVPLVLGGAVAVALAWFLVRRRPT